MNCACLTIKVCIIWGYWMGTENPLKMWSILASNPFEASRRRAPGAMEPIPSVSTTTKGTCNTVIHCTFIHTKRNTFCNDRTVKFWKSHERCSTKQQYKYIQIKPWLWLVQDWDMEKKHSLQVLTSLFLPSIRKLVYIHTYIHRSRLI